MKIPPLITPINVDKETAANILQNAIFSMSMSEDLDNITLCLLAAMKQGVEALQREIAGVQNQSQ